MPAAAEIIRARWTELVVCVTAEPGVVDFELQSLLTAYAGPDRHYHDQRHIAALLKQSRDHRPALADAVAVDLAIIYHDAVYEPSRSDNETQSAELARRSLAGLAMPEDVIAKVARYIEATKHGEATTPPGADSDLDLLLDLDLSILAAAPADYDAYAAAIRREYAIYPDIQYRRGRADVLGRMLATPALYRTPSLAAAWESRARENLGREIAHLGSS